MGVEALWGGPRDGRDLGREMGSGGTERPPFFFQHAKTSFEEGFLKMSQIALLVAMTATSGLFGTRTASNCPNGNCPTAYTYAQPVAAVAQPVAAAPTYYYYPATTQAAAPAAAAAPVAAATGYTSYYYAPQQQAAAAPAPVYQAAAQPAPVQVAANTPGYYYYYPTTYSTCPNGNCPR